MKANPLQKLSPTAQGYVFALITMCVWGGFSLMARLNVHWGIRSWDIIALRYGVSALILLPIVLYKKDHHLLWYPYAPEPGAAARGGGGGRGGVRVGL